MSDEFLSDISAAVDNGGKVETTPIETPKQESQQKPQEVKPHEKETASVADELSSMFESNDPYKEPTPKKEEETTPKKDEEVEEKTSSEEEEENVEKKAPPRTKRKGQERLLDTFLEEDENGNLVNADGEIIALAGKSRTYYEGLKNEARKQRKAASDLAISHVQLSQQFKSLYDEYKQLQETGGSPIQHIVKETGFSESEAKEAVNLLRQYKTDPIGAIKNMLTQAKMSGINISEIGANITADPAAIRSTVQQLLDERLKPLNERNEREVAQEETLQEATAFLQQYPQARRYAPQIAQAKQKFPQMSLEEIWLRLRRELDNIQSNQQQSFTKHRKPARQTQAAPKKKVTPPKRNYGNMSFDEIAKSVEEDYN